MRGVVCAFPRPVAAVGVDAEVAAVPLDGDRLEADRAVE